LRDTPTRKAFVTYKNGSVLNATSIKGDKIDLKE